MVDRSGESHQIACDNFMKDFENRCLEHRWDNRAGHFPTGPLRYQDPAWSDMIRRECENHTDVSFQQYCEWCMEGGGDERFQKSDFYDAVEFDDPGELQYELYLNQRQRDLICTRLEMLMQRNPALQLVREARTDLYAEYGTYFNEKICKLTENIVALQRRTGHRQHYTNN